jgi:hypothetical protein
MLARAENAIAELEAEAQREDPEVLRRIGELIKQKEEKEKEEEKFREECIAKKKELGETLKLLAAQA